MSKVIFNIEAGVKYTESKIYDWLVAVGELGSSAAKVNAPKDKGNLIQEIDYEVMWPERLVRISANTIYAAIQEMGGDIVPKDAKALAVPVHPDAKAALIPEGSSIKDVFPDLIYIERNGQAPLLVREAGRGLNHGRFDIMYVLVQKVTIPAQPYLRPAIFENQKQILDLMRNGN